MDWAEYPHGYGLESLATSSQGYESDVVGMLKTLLDKCLGYSSARDDGIDFHSREQNARVVKNAESYYKAMYRGRDEAWNLRVAHMLGTLDRSTLGRFARRSSETRHSVSAHAGTVAAAESWDGDLHIIEVQSRLPGSYEELMHSIGIRNFILDLRQGKCDAELREALGETRLERFISVLYKSGVEKASHYSYASLTDQFDGFIWFDESRHVGILEVHQPKSPWDNHETCRLDCKCLRW
ncbi:hypothetical protein ACHAPQ_008698 [Fusarium lateritium]